ncbi:alpha/beta hydrolase fold domain-containing protein [Streptomyces sp. RFCAC02]|uniref:alpha/beta hydrolase n=1 Tax=Streptomyces sp. RFCAC02 TaxID=2499143 RepID=UPI001022101D|nr:alpha/beta hydrolase fold domain-containing protein [Streptomyces sp. RFCAC02]
MTVTAKDVETTSVVYGQSDRLMDVHRPADPPGDLPAVLLWHGSGADEREVLRPLARAVAAAGAVVLVPDWRSDTPDAGRAHLRDSVAFAVERAGSLGADAERITLGGWSRGGKAALGTAFRADGVDGWRPRAVVAIAGAGRTLAPYGELPRAGGPASPLPVVLVHGTADTLVRIERSRALHTLLTGQGWPVTLEEIDADHAGVVMAVHDGGSGRCVPSTDEAVARAGARTAGVLARAAGAVTG